MSDYELPELPSDDELGIAGMELDDEEAEPARPEEVPPAGAAPPPGGRPTGEASRSGPSDRPARRWRGPLTLLVLLVLAWLARAGGSVPAPVPATAHDTVFSSARAMVRMVELARRPHPPGSPEHARVRAEIVEALRDLGLEPEVQTTTSLVRRDRTARAATVRNVVARIAGTDPTGAVLVTAHYDGRGISPAAGDDASGVVAILEAVRALRAGEPLRNDVLVLVTDAEELGLLGARAFIEEHRWMQDVSVVLSVEMRGGGGPSIMFETGADNGWIVEALKAGDPRPMANSLSYEVYRRLPNDTDFTPFREAGKQGLNFAGIGRARVYHQAFDTPHNFQESTLQHHGVHVLGMLRELGGRDLTRVDAPDRVFFRLPVLGLVTYGTLWVPALGVILLLGIVGVVVPGRSRGVSTGSLVAGVLLSILATGLAAGAGWGLFRWVRSVHAEYGLLQGSAFHSEGWYVLATVAVAFAVVTATFGFARRRATLPGVAAGALLLPLLAALFLTFAAPLAAMNLQWPALAGLVGAAVVLGLPRPARPGLLRGFLLLLPSAVVLAFMVPLTELLWLAMSASFLPVLGALAALALLMLVPLLDVLGDPNRWWAPVCGMLLAAAFVGIGLLQSRPSAERPTPSTLAWTLDRETGEARWISRPGPALAWARERVGPLEVEVSLEAFGAGSAPALAEPTSPATLEPPEVVSLDPTGRPAAPSATSRDSTATPGDTAVAEEAAATPGDTVVTEEATATPGDTSTLAPPGPGLTRVALRSRIGAEMLTVRADSSSPVRWRAVQGVPVGGGPPIQSVVHWGTPAGGALLLDLEPPPGADSVRLVVVEHHLRPGELLGEEAFRRPPGLVPAVDWISDRALIRTVVTVPVGPPARTGTGGG